MKKHMYKKSMRLIVFIKNDKAVLGLPIRLLTVSVDFSESLRFIVFGSMPQNGALEPTVYTLDETMNNNYYFIANDGTILSYRSNARFSSDDITQIVLFGPGSYDLKIELVKDMLGGKTYVTIS